MQVPRHMQTTHGITFGREAFDRNAVIDLIAGRAVVVDRSQRVPIDPKRHRFFATVLLQPRIEPDVVGIDFYPSPELRGLDWIAASYSACFVGVSQPVALAEFSRISGTSIARILLSLFHMFGIRISTRLLRLLRISSTPVANLLARRFAESRRAFSRALSGLAARHRRNRSRALARMYSRLVEVEYGMSSYRWSGVPDGGW